MNEIDADKPGDEQPGAITDQAAYAAKAEGRIEELRPGEAVASEPAARRKRRYDPDLDKRQDKTEGFLQNAIGTLGMPKTWGRVLKAAAPAVGVAARELIQALNPDSPGGARLTPDELEDIAQDAGRRFYRELVREFAGGR